MQRGCRGSRLWRRLGSSLNSPAQGLHDFLSRVIGCGGPHDALVPCIGLDDALQAAPGLHDQRRIKGPSPYVQRMAQCRVQRGAHGGDPGCLVGGGHEEPSRTHLKHQAVMPLHMPNKYSPGVHCALQITFNSSDCRNNVQACHSCYALSVLPIMQVE